MITLNRRIFQPPRRHAPPVKVEPEPPPVALLGKPLSKPDLIICVRAHKDATLVLDCLDSVKWSCDPSTTQICAAVDANAALAQRLQDCHIPTYLSPVKRGWGVGLFSMLMDSINWARGKWGITHFMTIDYDTLFLNQGVDAYFLSLITSEQIGLIGKHNPDNVHWRDVFGKQKKSIEKVLGPTPPGYIPGEGVQGGCFALTSAGIQALAKNGFLAPPKKEAKHYTTIADDHLITLVTRCCGMSIVDGGAELACSWKAYRDPRGLEKKGILVFHPVKMVSFFQAQHRGTEIEIRNYFRRLRGRELLKR